jgi:hypothetical protein
VGDSGINSTPYVHFRTLSDITDLAAQSEYVNVPVHNFVDDVTWTKGKHTLQFGTNLRLVQNNRSGNFQNVSYAVTDPFSLDTNAGIANEGSSLDPGISASPASAWFHRRARSLKCYCFVIFWRIQTFHARPKILQIRLECCAGDVVFRHRRPFGRRE